MCPLCQRSCRLNRMEPLGASKSNKTVAVPCCVPRHARASTRYAALSGSPCHQSYRRCRQKRPVNPRTDGVVPKKLRALKELYFYVQTVEVGSSAVSYGQAGENALRFPHLAHRSAAVHKLHSTAATSRLILIPGKVKPSAGYGP